jgi:hypothetical protein
MAAAQGSTPCAARLLAVCGIMAIMALEPKVPSRYPPPMDPLSLIVAALAAGAAAAAKDTAGAAIRDSYQGLKELIQRKLAGNQAAVVVLEEHEKDPHTSEALLKKKLAEAAVDQDPEIQRSAETLLEQLKALPGTSQVITQSISNVKYAATSGSGDASIGPIHEQPPGHG